MKKFGIRVTIPESSTMAKPHLLGENWESFRWYETEAERDQAYQEMASQPFNYRTGDTIQQILEKVERPGAAA